MSAMLRDSVLTAHEELSGFLTSMAEFGPEASETQQALDGLCQKIQQNLVDPNLHFTIDQDGHADTLLSYTLRVRGLSLKYPQGAIHTLQRLIDAGADLNEPIGTSSAMFSPLHVAASCAAPEVLKYMVQQGARVEGLSNNSLGITPLHAAIMAGREDNAIVLMQMGASVSAAAANGYRPIHIAAQYDAVRVMLALLNRGLNVDQLTDFSQVAEANGQVAMLRCTPLHIAVLNGRLEAVDFLLRQRANIQHINAHGDSVFHIAAASNQAAVLHRLLEFDASLLNTNNLEGCTPLHLAAANESLQSLQVLLIHQADVFAEARQGDTALHFAVASGSLDAVRLLLQADPAINALSDFGMSPLHLAVRANNQAMIQLLLTAGADTSQPDGSGKTPVDLARDMGYYSTWELLLLAHHPVEV